MSHIVTITPQSHPQTFAAKCTCGWKYDTNAIKWVVLGMQKHYVDTELTAEGRGLVVDRIAGDGLDPDRVLPELPEEADRLISLAGISIANYQNSTFPLQVSCYRDGCHWTVTYNLNSLLRIAEDAAAHTCTGGKARCRSCDHLLSGHDGEGCKYAITAKGGVKDLVCPCAVIPR